MPPPHNLVSQSVGYSAPKKSLVSYGLLKLSVNRAVNVFLILYRTDVEIPRHIQPVRNIGIIVAGDESLDHGGYLPNLIESLEQLL